MTSRLVRRRLAVLLVGAVCIWWLTGPAASAQEAVSLAGDLRNGTPLAAFRPQEVPVTLRVLEGSTIVESRTAAPGLDGRFTFQSVRAVSGRTYFLSAEYQGAVYSATVATEGLAAPVPLTVYEATSSPDALTVEEYTVLVTGADASQRVVEVFERVGVANRGHRTLVPDLAQGGRMGFLRFGLPPGSFNLDVRSDLVGGQVLEVDRGFALTTPVPPTLDDPHQFEFIYRLSYEGSTVDLGRSLPFGAGPFRLVMPATVGTAVAPMLTDLGQTTMGEREMRLFEATSLEPGTRLEVRLEGLPQPSWWTRLGQGSGRWYLAAGVPGLMGVALLGLLVFSMLGRRSAGVLAEAPADASSRRRLLLEEAAALEARFQRGGVSQSRYQRERDWLKQALLRLEMRQHLAESEEPEQPS